MVRYECIYIKKLNKIIKATFTDKLSTWVAKRLGATISCIFRTRTCSTICKRDTETKEGGTTGEMNRNCHWKKKK